MGSTTWRIPGPFASRLLVDLGADVLKIEEPTRGDYLRDQGAHINDSDTGYLFALLNHGKRSLTLNLKEREGVEVFERMCAEADVVLESFRPGVMDKLGLGAAELRQRHPHLIYCSINGYGSTGPYAHLPGHDHNYLATAGAASLLGEPRLMPVPIADLESGQRAVVAILAAIVARGATGEGRQIEVAMLDGAVSWMIQALADYWGDGIEPASSTEIQPRGLERFLGPSPGYSYYEAADGKWVAVAASEEKFWIALCESLELPDLVDSPRPAEELDQELRAVFLTRDADDWLTLLLREGLAAAPVNSVADAVHDPQVESRGLLYRTRDERLGEFFAIANVLGVGRRLTPEVRVPGLGEDTSDVLRSLGFPAEAIAGLRASGVV